LFKSKTKSKWRKEDFSTDYAMPLTMCNKTIVRTQIKKRHQTNFSVDCKISWKIWPTRQERQENRQERREQRRELKDEFRAQKNEMKQEWQDKKPPIQPSMTGGNLWDSLRHQMNQAKADNEQRQDEPTADANVWEQLMGEIQKLEAQPTGQVQSQPQQQRQQPQQPQSAQPTEARHNPWAPSGAAPIAQGVIISDGSVNLRAQPNMAAPRSEFRIQSGAVVNLVGEDKSNPVNLDGNVCGWCKVSVDGVEGWLPDAYLGSA